MRARGDVAEFDDLVPADDPLLDRIPHAGLTFGLDGFLPVGDDEIGAAHGLVVVLAPSALQPAALHERAVGAHDRDDMLPGLQPCAVEHRHVGARRADHHVGAANDLLRLADGNELRLDQFAHALAEGLAVLGAAAVDLVGLDLALVLEREDLVQRLSARAEHAADLRILARQMAEADAARRRRAQRHERGKADALFRDLADHDALEFRRGRVPHEIDGMLAVGIGLIVGGMIVHDALAPASSSR